MNTNKIYLEKRECFEYPDSKYYFSPHIHYPEYPFAFDTISPFPNEVYDMVRSSLLGMGLDADRYGTEKWNPLGDYIESGARILLKPNWACHSNHIGGLDCTVTHPSIIRCVVDYCVIAGAGLIEIGDAPIQGCDFDLLMNIHGYNCLFDFARAKGVNILVSDFRMTISKQILKRIVIKEPKSFGANQNDVIEFDLKNHSHFFDVAVGRRYRALDYHDEKLNMRHNADHHKYLIRKSVFDADLIINLPKPKSHRFAGVTAAQKNFIGICPEKDYLPHYRTGSQEDGGDEYKRSSLMGNVISYFNQERCKYIEKKNIPMQILFCFLQYGAYYLNTLFSSKQITQGRWHGNDTIWRTILDINLILHYGNFNGSLDINFPPKRNIITIGDMIVAGEKEGPLRPSPKKLGAILISDNCVLFDYVFCKMAQFNYNFIPAIKNALSNNLLSPNLDAARLYSNVHDFHDTPINTLVFPDEWKFISYPGWEDLL